MKPERDKTTRVSTCADLQVQEMKNKDTVGLMCGQGEGEVQVRALEFAGRVSTVKERANQRGVVMERECDR